MRVLIIDDDVGIRRVLAREMGRLGHETLQANDGVEGIALAKKSKPSVILLDLRMPRMDGHAFLKQLASEDLKASVIVLSGHADLNDRVNALLAGAVQFVPKPWTPGDLGKALQRAAERQASQAA